MNGSDNLEEVGMSGNGGGDIGVFVIAQWDTWDGLSTLCVCCQWSTRDVVMTKSKSQEAGVCTFKRFVNLSFDLDPLTGSQQCIGVVGGLLHTHGRHVGTCMGCRCSPFSSYIHHKLELSLPSCSLHPWIDFWMTCHFGVLIRWD